MERRRRMALVALTTTGVVGAATFSLTTLPDLGGPDVVAVGEVAAAVPAAEWTALRDDLVSLEAQRVALGRQLAAARQDVKDAKASAARAAAARAAAARQAVAAQRAVAAQQARASAVARSQAAPTTHTSTGASGSTSGEREHDDEGGESDD